MHAASCMNQKHLLRFIKKKAKKFGDEIVCTKGGKCETLNEVSSAKIFGMYIAFISSGSCFHRVEPCLADGLETFNRNLNADLELQYDS